MLTRFQVLAYKNTLDYFTKPALRNLQIQKIYVHYYYYYFNIYFIFLNLTVCHLQNRDNF